MDKTVNTQKDEQLQLKPIKRQKPYFYFVLASAFLGALLLWLYAIGYDSTFFDRKITNVPVTITGIDTLYENKRFMVAEELDINITVTISGKRSQINSMSADDLVATVDVSEIEQAGEASLPIKVTPPNGINVVELNYDSVVLFLDEFVVKTVPVNAVLNNYVLPNGLKLGESKVNPVVTTIEGPESELSRINSAYVDLSLGEVKGRISAYGPVLLRYDNGERVESKYIKIGVEQAYVNIEVYKEKTIPVRVVFTGGVFTAESAVIRLSDDMITVSGNVNIIDSIDAVTLMIDETSHNLKKPINVSEYLTSLLPAGVNIESGKVLLTAEIEITDITSKYFYIPASKIEKVYGDDQPEFRVDSGVTVTVVGYREVLNSMTPSSVIASVNAENIFVDENNDEIAYVDFDFTEGIYGVYVYEDYLVDVTTIIPE